MKNRAAGACPTRARALKTFKSWIAALLLCAAPAWAALAPQPDATVADGATALAWDACAWGQTRSGSACTGAAAPLTWAQALAAAQQANTAAWLGHTDWRVPNRTELESLVQLGASPAIDTAAFPGATGGFWSSTSYQSAPAQAWGVDFTQGDSLPAAKTAVQALRLVRGGTGASAYAPSPTAALPLPGGGTAQVLVSSPSGGCYFNTSQFKANDIADPLPQGAQLAGNLFDFVLDGCAPGETATLRITYPSLPAHAQYWKHGPTPANPTAHWYRHPATVSGNTITFSITNGGDGDDDLDGANSQIVDAGGPVLLAAGGAAAAIPTLSQWGVLLLCGLLGLSGLAARRRAARSLRGRRRRSETCEKRGQRGNTEKPIAELWAQEVVPRWAVFSHVAADVPSAAQTPRPPAR
jgi:hypothetical protein